MWSEHLTSSVCDGVRGRFTAPTLKNGSGNGRRHISWHETGVISRAANRATSLTSSQSLDHVVGLPSGVGSMLRSPCNVNRPSVLGPRALRLYISPEPSGKHSRHVGHVLNQTLRQTLEQRSSSKPLNREAGTFQANEGIIRNNAKEKNQSNHQVCALRCHESPSPWIYVSCHDSIDFYAITKSEPKLRFVQWHKINCHKLRKKCHRGCYYHRNTYWQ